MKLCVIIECQIGNCLKYIFECTEFFFKQKYGFYETMKSCSNLICLSEFVKFYLQSFLYKPLKKSYALKVILIQTKPSLPGRYPIWPTQECFKTIIFLFFKKVIFPWIPMKFFPSKGITCIPIIMVWARHYWSRALLCTLNSIYI